MIKHVMSDGSERESIEGLVVPAGHPAYKVIQKMREEGAMRDDRSDRCKRTKTAYVRGNDG